MREFRVPFDKISKFETIRGTLEKVFREKGLDLHRHDVVSMEDDHDKKVRILRVQTKVYPYTQKRG